MIFKNFIGVDVSKRTLDLCLITVEGRHCFYHCPNTIAAIADTLNLVYSEHDLPKDQTLLCAEHTSHYSKHLQQVCIADSYQLWMENPHQIKCSQGVQRGKDDKQDASRIAVYAQRFVDKAVIVQPSRAIYEQLAYLSAERELLLSDASKYKAQLKDEARFIDQKLFKAKNKRIQRLIKDWKLLCPLLKSR
jgi:transposase